MSNIYLSSVSLLTTMLKYTPDDYNQYNVLHIPFTLLLITIYLLKHYFIVALPFLARVPVFNMLAEPLLLLVIPDQHSSGPLFYASFLAFIVMVSMASRLPQTRSAFLRWVWQHGYAILLLNLLLEIAFIALYAWLGFKKFNGISLAFIYLDAVFIVVLLKSSRIRDVFAEFPAYSEGPKN